MNAARAALADGSGEYLAWFAQQLAIQQSADLVVMGHTHTPVGGLSISPVNYYNNGFECASGPDNPPELFTFTVVDLEAACGDHHGQPRRLRHLDRADARASLRCHAAGGGHLLLCTDPQPDGQPLTLTGRREPLRATGRPAAPDDPRRRTRRRMAAGLSGAEGSAGTFSYSGAGEFRVSCPTGFSRTPFRVPEATSSPVPPRANGGPRAASHPRAIPSGHLHHRGLTCRHLGRLLRSLPMRCTPQGSCTTLIRTLFTRAWTRSSGASATRSATTPPPWMSMNLDCEPIFFDYDNKHWMIELWKGQYGLEVGCEIGVYTRPIGSSGLGYDLLDATIGQRPGDSIRSHNLFYDCASDADRLPLQATLKLNGEKLFTRGPEPHWWLTGFKWGRYADPSQFTVDVAITLKEPGDADSVRERHRRTFIPEPEHQRYNGLVHVTASFADPAAQACAPSGGSAGMGPADRQQVPGPPLPEQRPEQSPGRIPRRGWTWAAASHRQLRLGGVPACTRDGQGHHDDHDRPDRWHAIAGSAVEAWLSSVKQTFATWVTAIEGYLGLQLDFACYVEIDNTKGPSDLVLTGASARYGNYVVPAVVDPEGYPRAVRPAGPEAEPFRV